MRIFIIFALSCAALALNIQFENPNEKIIAIKKGLVYKLEYFGVLEYRLDLSNYFHGGSMSFENKAQIIVLCLELKENANCEMVASLLSTFSNDTGHSAVDKQLLGIKYSAAKETTADEFKNIIRPIIVSAIKDNDITDPLLSLFFQPNSEDILRLFDTEQLLSDVKRLEKTVWKNYEEIANGENMQMEEILFASQFLVYKSGFDDGFIIQIKIPIVIVDEWHLYDMIPMLFVEWNKPHIVGDVKKYIACNKYDDCIYFKNDELDSCINLGQKRYACEYAFGWHDDVDCELNLLTDNDDSACHIEPSREFSRVFRINSNTFLINTHQNLTLYWGCDNFENSFPIAGNAWVQVNSGCFFRVDNQTYIMPIGKNQNNATYHVNIASGIHGTIYNRENKTLLIQEFQARLKYLSKIDGNLNQSSTYSAQINPYETQEMYFIIGCFIFNLIAFCVVTFRLICLELTTA